MYVTVKVTVCIGTLNVECGTRLFSECISWHMCLPTAGSIAYASNDAVTARRSDLVVLARVLAGFAKISIYLPSAAR